MHEKLGNMKYLLTAACLLFLFMGCKSDNDDQKPADRKSCQRTVIFYLSGENTLSGNVNDDLQEIKKGSVGLADDDRIVAFIDRENELPYIAEIKDGKTTLDQSLTFSEDFYASDPSKMQSILNHIMTQYPSKSYGLVLWGHADGWLITPDSIATDAASGSKRRLGVSVQSFGQDTGTDNKGARQGAKWINIPSLASTLESLPCKFRFIMADCCNFQCVETAYELRHCTDYLIGSPAEIPNYGAPYDKLLAYMFDESDLFYHGIVDTYYSQEDYSGKNYRVPLSVIRTDQLESLAHETKEVLSSIDSRHLKTDGILYYWTVRYSNGYAPIMYDMRALLSANLPQEAQDRINSAIDKAVVYSKFSDYWMSSGTRIGFGSFTTKAENSCSMSMFLPMDAYTATNMYGNLNKSITQMQWYEASGLKDYGQ